MTLDRAVLSEGQAYVPGILGGLGPLAHVTFERAILARGHLRGARGDREHPVWLVASAASTPGRTSALLGGGESPIGHLTTFTQLLERSGADALFVVCNTAHAYHAEVQRALRIPWVHLMRLVADAIGAAFPAGTPVGVLATDGTLAARLYHDALEERGLVTVAPDVATPIQARVRAAIGDPTIGIKATGAEVSGAARDHLLAAARWCVERGARVLVPGCTEVSVGLTPEVFGEAPLVDPLTVAADALLDVAYARRPPSTFFSARPAPEGRS
jgi:aspartate racemase